MATPKSIDKYINIYVDLDKNQLGLRPYVASDIKINAAPEAKVQYAELQEYINKCLDDEFGVFIANGNFFEFAYEVFGFRRGVFIPDAIIKWYDNYKKVKSDIRGILAQSVIQRYKDEDLVKQELKEIKNFEIVKNKKGKFVGFSEDDLKKFDELSVDTKIEYFVNSLRSNKDEFVKSDFFKARVNEMYYEIQKRIYDPYIDVLATMLKPLVDAKKLVLIAPGNEEVKVDNFRQYDPLQKLAEKLGIPEKYSNSRFWLLNVGFKNELTDNTTQRIIIAGSYIGKANEITGANSKQVRAFKQLPAFDAQIISGTTYNAVVQDTVTYVDKFGNPIFKNQYKIYTAGHVKTRSNNNVESASFTIQNPSNDTLPLLMVSRAPAYITDKLVDENGKLIEFNEEYFNEQKNLTNKVVQNSPTIVKKEVFWPAYQLYISTENIKTPSKLLEMARKNTAKTDKKIGLAFVDLVDNLMISMHEKVINKNLEAIKPREDSEDFIKRFPIK